MKDEIIDIIDESENIIGTAKRDEAIRKNLMRWGVDIYVFNSKGLMLIHKRDRVKKQFPEHWDIRFGGFVQSGESLEYGARREIEEEIGAKDAKLKFMYKYRLKDDSNNDLNYVYFLKGYDKKIIPQPEEVAECGWIDPRDLPKIMKEKKFIPVLYGMYESQKDKLFQDDEIVDIVDEKGKVIGTMGREEANKKGLMIKVSRTIITNTDGRILVHKRALEKKDFPGFWDFGVAETAISGESYKDCAVRGLKEEMGITAKKDGLKEEFRYVYSHKNTKRNFMVYSFIYDGKIRLQEEEVSEARYVSEEELAKMLASEKFVRQGMMIYEKYKQDHKR